MEITKTICYRCHMCVSRKHLLENVIDDGHFVWLYFSNRKDKKPFFCPKKWCPNADIYMPHSIDTANLKRLRDMEDDEKY